MVKRINNTIKIRTIRYSKNIMASAAHSLLRHKNRIQEQNVQH